MRKSAFILGALSFSLLIPALSFCLCFVPSMAHPGHWTGRLFAVLDAPVSAVNVVLPAPLQSGLAHRFLRQTYCFPGPLWYELSRYVAVGFAGYLLLFGMGWICVLGIARAGSLCGGIPPENPSL